MGPDEPSPPVACLKGSQVAPLTEAELEAVTIVFHQYETGLREGTIYARVSLLSPPQKKIIIINKIKLYPPNEQKKNWQPPIFCFWYPQMFFFLVPPKKKMVPTKKRICTPRTKKIKS